MTALPVMPLGFLGARKLLEGAAGAPLSFVLAASGQCEPLLLFVRAHAAILGYDAQITTLPFGTLGHHLRAPPSASPQAFLLTPWDFVEELDWRTGVPSDTPSLAECLARARAIAARLAGDPRAVLIYVPAPTPPIFCDPAVDRELVRSLMIMAHELNARIVQPSAFELTPYLATGCPLASAALEHIGSLIARSVVDLVAPRAEPAKVLVTDLDNVMWDGVIAEDGTDGIAFGPDGRGWRHFLYQTLLKRLRAEGILIAAVSRNRPEDAAAPFRRGMMLLSEDDLVTVIASYHAKSAQIRRLAEELNLDLNALVFVDDNPIEIAEVERELPSVRRLQFPGKETEMPEFLAALSGHFVRKAVTDEDRRRTALYKQRLATLLPDEASSGDLTEFLSGLGMRLVMRDRSGGGHTRAIQLINKTNQFNLNGRRLHENELAALLAEGGRLITGELLDRTGSHGEVLALLVDGKGLVQSFVMSCRVFQRRAEHVFLMALAEAGISIRALSFVATDRNEPLRSFLLDPAFTQGSDDTAHLNLADFTERHGVDRSLIDVTWDAPS